MRVFWVNIAISKLNLLYRYCLKLIGELRKEKEEEFRQHCYRNSSVQIPTRPVSCVLEKSNCGNAITEIGKKEKVFLVIVAMVLPKMEKKKKLNGIMAMSLPKMEGKKILLPKSGKKF